MQVTVYSSLCKVDGSKSELLWLRELLTVDVPGAKYTAIYRRKQWDGKKRFFNLASYCFPMGLLSYVRKHADSAKIRVEVTDKRHFPPFDKSLPTLKGMELRPYQQKALLDCFKHRNCIVQAATNAGKTVIFAGLLKKLYPIQSLILIHRDEILWQTKDMVDKLTGLDIGVITAKDVYLRPITIAMVQTLTNRIGADQEITNFFKTTKCLIVDEVHHAVANTYQALLSASSAVYRFGFSGTVPEANTYKGMLTRAYIGDVEFEISNDELIKLGVSAEPKVFFFEIDLKERLRGIHDRAKEACAHQYGAHFDGQMLMKKVYQLSVDEGIVNNPERNEKVLDILAMNKGKSTLIVVDYLVHGKIVEKLLQSNGVGAQFVSGESENRQSAFQAFKQGKLQVLIGTTIFDEGVDVAKIECLIMLAGKKSRRQILQRVGRALRRKEGENRVAIYDFLDFGNRYLQRHAQQRYAIYKKEDFEITVL